MDILKVKISRKNNATIREILAVELPVMEELFPGGENDADIIVMESRRASKDDMARFLRRPLIQGVVDDTDIPDVELAFMNLMARYDTKDGAQALKSVYPSLNAFRRAFAKENGPADKKAA